MKFKITFLIILLPFVVSAQSVLSQKEIMDDYTIFKNILTNGHPSLYEYTSKPKWDSLFNHFEQYEIQQIKTSADLFKSMSALADNAKDGHLIIHPAKMEVIPPMFPLLIKIIDKKFYTDTDDFDIPLGSEIISIDSSDSKQLLQQMLKYAPTDGFNTTKKYRQIESEFGILHYHEYGEKKNYLVTYSTPHGTIKTTNIKSEPFESIGKRNAYRNSYFSAYHQYQNKAAYFENRINQKMPFVYYIDSINSAVLTVNSFGVDPKEFKDQLIGLFADFQKKKVKHLIIDIRQNIGGYRINAINLFSFITEQPFQQRISESAIISTLPQKEHLIHTMSDFDDFFKSYFASTEKEVDCWVLKKDHAQNEMTPYKKPFKGNVLVLIGGKTFSAGATFALSAKNNSNITLIGEEAGGGYYFHTGQYPALYQLPNSKIMVRMSVVKINHYINDKSTAKGSGILPDVEINLTPHDLIDGKDSQLYYIIKRIEKK